MMTEPLMSSVARFQIDRAAGESALLRARSADGKDALRDVAREFEALFVKQMLSSMRATLDKENDMLYGGMSQDIFEDMLYTEYSKVIAKTGSLGISDLIYEQLK